MKLAENKTAPMRRINGRPAPFRVQPSLRTPASRAARRSSRPMPGRPGASIRPTVAPLDGEDLSQWPVGPAAPANRNLAGAAREAPDERQSFPCSAQRFPGSAQLPPCSLHSSSLFFDAKRRWCWRSGALPAGGGAASATRWRRVCGTLTRRSSSGPSRVANYLVKSASNASGNRWPKAAACATFVHF